MEENKIAVRVVQSSSPSFSVEPVEAADKYLMDEEEVEAFIEAIRDARHLPCCQRARGK